MMIKIWVIILFLLSANSTNAAAGAGEAGVDASDTISLKALACITKCSRIILETNFAPAKNKVVAGDQVLMMLNLLSSLPGDNPLKENLAARGMLVDPKVFAEYNRQLTAANLRRRGKRTPDSNLSMVYKAILLPRELDHKTIPITLREFGADVKLVLDDSQTAQVVSLINGLAMETTKGLFSKIIIPDDLKSINLAVLTASYFKSSWKVPFEKEIEAPFKTVGGNKSVTYLSGQFVGNYKRDSLGEIISIPLKNRAKFIVFKRLDGAPSFFDFSMLEGSKEKNLKLMLPKIKIESNIDLKEILEASGFTGLRKSFFNNKLELGKFYQKTFVNTTLEGVEAGAISFLSVLLSENIEITVDHPYSIAIILPIGDIYVPLFTGYIGDPTLS